MTTEQEPPASRSSEGDQAEGEQGSAAANAAPESPQQARPGGAGQDFNQLLQQNIAQAIQPIIADFRQQMHEQMAANLQETEVEQPAAVNGKSNDKEAQQMAINNQQAEPQPAGNQTATDEQPSQTVREAVQTQQPQDQSQPSQQTQGESQTQQKPQAQSQPAQAQPQEQAPTQTEDSGKVQSLVSSGVRPALNTGLRLVEQQSEQWIRAMIVAGIEALLTEKTHEAAQQQAERGLNALLEKTLESLPDNSTNRELKAQAERTLQAILRDSIDAMFAESVRSTLVEHGALAGQELVHRNPQGALQHAQQALQAFIAELVSVLRHQWQRVLRLLLKLILTALQDSLGSNDKDEDSDVSSKAEEA